MKVYISKYRNHWISPYTMIENICFWKADIDYDDPWVKRWANILTPVSVAIQSILNRIHPEINYVKIDYYDTWSMDTTLSPIILPMLKQLRQHKHGAPAVDYDDVPARLRPTTQQVARYRLKGETDPKFFKRWDWVLDEMIWAFEQLCDEHNDAKFFSGEWDMTDEACEWDANGKATLFKMIAGPNHTYKFDSVAYQKHAKRISNGTRLFGKYYQSLWD